MGDVLVFCEVQIGENSPGGGDGQRHLLYAEALEGVGAEAAGEGAVGGVIYKRPTLQCSDEGAVFKPGAEPLFVALLQQNLLWGVVAQQQIHKVQIALRGAEISGGYVQKGGPCHIFLEIE